MTSRDPPSPLLPLPPHLVQKGRPGRGDVQRPHAPGQGNPDQQVARPGHQGPETPPLATQDQDEGPTDNERIIELLEQIAAKSDPV